MTKQKYTPGPWKSHGVRSSHRNQNGSISVHLDKPYKLYSIQQIVNMPNNLGFVTTFIADVQRCGDMSDEELHANATLIASAPKMAEIVKGQKAKIGVLWEKIETRDILLTDRENDLTSQAKQIERLRETVEQTLNTINGLGGIPSLDRSKLQKALRAALAETKVKQ